MRDSPEIYINAHGPTWYTYLVARLAGSSPFGEAQLHARDLELAMHVADTQMFGSTYNGIRVRICTWRLHLVSSVCTSGRLRTPRCHCKAVKTTAQECGFRAMRASGRSSAWRGTWGHWQACWVGPCCSKSGGFVAPQGVAWVRR